MTLRDWLLALVVSFAGTFLGIVFTTVAPVLPLIAQHYGGGHEGAFVAEWLLTMPSIGIMVGGPTAGWFVERLGARAVLLICFIVFGLAGMGGLFIENSSLLLASRFVAGVTAAGAATAATAAVGDRFVGERRSFMLGFQVALAAIIGIGITVASGTLAQKTGWRAPFALYGLALAVALLAAAVVERSPTYRQKAQGRGISGMIALLPVFAVIIVTMMVSFISSNQVPLVLSELGASPFTLSLMLAGNTLATSIGALLYSRIRTAFGASRTSAVGGILQALAVFFLAIAQGVGSITAASILLGLGSGILYPGFSHMILDRAPEAARGRAIGLLFTAQFAGPFLSTALLVPSIAAFGRQNSLLAIGAALLVGWTALALRNAGNARASPAA
jgi:MFS family permease